MYWSKPSLGTRLVRLGVGGEGPRWEPVVRKRETEKERERKEERERKRERERERQKIHESIT